MGNSPLILRLLVAGSIGAGLTQASFAQAPACQITKDDNGNWDTGSVAKGQVLTFGDMKIRIADIDGIGVNGIPQWVVIDVKVPTATPTYGLRLALRQTAKVTACGPEATITFDYTWALSLGRTLNAGPTIRVSVF